MHSRLVIVTASAALAAGALVAPATVQADSVQADPGQRSSHALRSPQPTFLGHYKHVVVLYQENHSFDNLYGHWGNVGGDHLDGVADAPRRHTVQVAQDGTRYKCLPQNDVNLTSPPLATTCHDPAHGTPKSRFTNRPFTIDHYIAPSDKTCPKPGVFAEDGVLKNSPGALPGGCTRDLVHRFYQEQYQINGGRQNRYLTGSDALGLTMGTYATKRLPIYRYLHAAGAPHYVIADRFFQGAHGGSFLNHQWLIAGRAPIDNSHGRLGAEHSVVDANGMPTEYPQYTPTRKDVVDGQLTRACPGGHVANYKLACGDFAVNTVQPASPPFKAGDPQIGLINDKRYPNIGDRLTAKGISWNWYSGGWWAAAAGHPGPLFQYHHQPFNYFAAYAPGKPGRAHLKGEANFFKAARSGHLPTVSFVKPYGAENEHPGYASATGGDRHLVKLIRAVLNGPQARSTLIIVTYDEFGGQWDHVPPPGPGSSTPGPYDAFGPGTRIPALFVAKNLRRSGVDHRSYDTTSIIASMERSFDVRPVGIRDRRVHSLRHVLSVGGVGTRR
jgi:acid phosphatase